MSQNPPQTRSNSSYDICFDNALKAYKQKTGKDLASDPLLHRLETCGSPDSVLDALREQVPNFDQSGTRNGRLVNWLNPTVNVLYGFSTMIGGAAGSIYPLAGIVFTGIGTLLSAVQAVGASRGAMIVLFERIETYFRRLETYIELPRAAGMMDIIVKVMVEVLIVLALATRENKQGRIKRFLKKLIGKSDIRDALGRLDKLMQYESEMVAAQGLRATHNVDEGVAGIRNDVQGVGGQLAAVIDGGERLSRELQQVANDVDSQKRKQLRQDLQNWLSSPDPTINFNAASDAHHEGTTSWYTNGRAFKDWNASGCFMWICGKPGSGKTVLISAIVRDIRDSGSGLVAIFFFDFKDVGKQDIRALLSSLIVQLSYESDSFYDILLDFYSTHRDGLQQPTVDALTQCLKNILKTPGETPIYLIVDALDECPGTPGITSPREKVLELVEVLVGLRVPNLRLCVTSRAEFDIGIILEPLTSAHNRISLHDESGQKEAISNYVSYVVKMQRWKEEDKRLVIETLSERADGMFRWVFCQLEALRHCLPPSVRYTLAELPKSLDETYERILREIPKVNQVHTHRLLQCLTVTVRPLTVEELAEVFAIDFPVAGGIPKLDESSRCEDQEHAVLSACSSLIAIVEHNGSRRVHFSHFSVKEFLISDRLAGKTVDASHYHIRLYSACTTMAQVCLAALLRFDDQMDEKTIKSYPLAEYAGQHFTDHADSEVVLKELNDDGLDRLFDPDKPHFDIWWRLRNGDQAGDNPYDAQLSVQEPEPEPEPVSPVSIAVEQGLTAVAQYDYEAAEGDELSLVGGELIVGIIQEATDWWSGSSADGTRAGLFPATYVTLVDMLPELEPVDEGVVAVASYDNDAAKDNEVSVSSICQTSSESSFDLNLSNPDPDHPGASPLKPGHPLSTYSKRPTPLHCIVRLGHFFLAQHLISKRQQDHNVLYEGMTLSHFALYMSNFKISRLALTHCVDVDVRGIKNWTALHIVASTGRLELTRILLERQAEVDPRDNKRRTPLYCAMYRAEDKSEDEPTGESEGESKDDSEDKPDVLDCARLLLDYNADVDAQNNCGRTPLHQATSKEVIGAVRLLLERGADVDLKDDKGETALHRASRRGNVDITRLLINYRANVDVQDNKGSTPLHLAASSVDNEVPKLLLEHGASVHVQNKEGKTPFQVASVSVKDLLSEHMQGVQEA